MLRWLNKNKTWFWSGAGGVIITLIVSILGTYFSSPNNKQNSSNNKNNNNININLVVSGDSSIAEKGNIDINKGIISKTNINNYLTTSYPYTSETDNYSVNNIKIKNHILEPYLINNQETKYNIISDDQIKYLRKEFSYKNFKKSSSYYSIRKNQYILVAHSLNSSTSRYNFDRDNVHVVLNSKNDKSKILVNRDNLTIINIGDFVYKGAEKYTIFKFTMVIDNSGSIDDENLQILENVLTKFIKSIPTAFEAQVIKFSQGVQLKSAFLKDKNKIIEQIHQRYERDTTSLYDSIFVGVKELEATDSEDVFFKFCLVLTDGVDTSSIKYKDPNLFINKIESYCLKYKIPIFIIGITDNVNTVLLERLTKNIGLFEQVANYSEADLEHPFEIIIHMINNTYIFRIPAIPDFENLDNVFLVKKCIDKYEIIQDFIFSTKTQVTERNKDERKSNTFQNEKLTSMINRKIKPLSGPNIIYVSHLSFMEPTTGSSLFKTELGSLLNYAIVDGINLLFSKQTDSIIKHNEPDHMINDTDNNLNTLVNIIFDPNLTKSEKITKIIKEMMIPNNIDVIITGQYIDKGSEIDVRPLIIDSFDQKVVTKVAVFPKNQFICKNPNNQNVMTLCQSAHDEISVLVKELLETL